MRNTHHIGFEEYEDRLKDQLEVEKNRDKEYKNSKNITKEYNQQVFK